ncbi:MAG TPA: MBL fold metallo-hydrolase [Thermoleophilaceae bacterium]|nr:MBL fold metallo-hydrolase [Thermoleophilaceae bacterium]
MSAARLLVSRPKRVADGVWLVRGGFPLRMMNVYLVENPPSGRQAPGGVVVFDAGVAVMRKPILDAAAGLGGIERVVLSHAHVDHRGAAPRLGAPVWCHEDERADVEGDGGIHYMDFSLFDAHGRATIPRLAPLWDGGPVRVDGTLAEGDEVAGFEVVGVPGHSPGQIALWRERDGLTLCSDCFYAIDAQIGLKGPPRVPHRAFNWDHAMARESLRKLAGLKPRMALPGHGDPLAGDVAGTLRYAAETT